MKEHCYELPLLIGHLPQTRMIYICPFKTGLTVFEIKEILHIPLVGKSEEADNVYCAPYP